MSGIVRFIAMNHKDVSELKLDPQQICDLFVKAVPNDRLKAIMAAGLLSELLNTEGEASILVL